VRNDFGRRLTLAACLCLGHAAALAQAETFVRSATAAEIQGDWQLLPVSDALQPSVLKTNPWPAQCQWYSYSASGELKSTETLKGPCDALTAKQLHEALARVPAVIGWKYDLNPLYKLPLITVTRSDVARYREYWEAELVVKPFSKYGLELRQGDLILYLIDLKTRKRAIVRPLRRLP
jgi:hypothetical protein